jgi:hypothetical protein
MHKKILVLGVEQNNFLSFLYSSLKLYNTDFKISAPFVREIEKSVKNDSWMYENDIVSKKKSLASVLKSLLFILTNKHTYQTFFFILFVEGKFKKAGHFMLKQFVGKAFFIQNNNFNDFDTFHFHYMQYSYLRELFFVPKGKKIICTFWGSDLLRTNDVFNFYFVKKALNRSNIITCQSLELKEIILSKFGRNLDDKIKIAIFPVDEKIYETIDFNENSTEAINAFKLKYDYSSSKTNILIGHNANPSNNHIKIIESLKVIQNKDKIHLIVNLNYALDAHKKLEYKATLTQVLEQSGMSFILLETFFSKEELAISRLATDIFIHLPISDALSGTMLEMMYASSIVITGSWLPYKTFRNAGLNYHEVSSFDNLPDKVVSIMANFKSEKGIVKGNKWLIRQYFFSVSIINNWAQILN